MHHFLILINYSVPFEKIAPTLPEHREHLQRQVDAGVILLSGPRNPRTGGLIIARANSEEQIRKMIADDPYKRDNLAEYELIEFNPGKHQSFLADWIAV
ncbi:MAG: YciI family protein [Candidatus Zixiibacteriota bacterium]